MNSNKNMYQKDDIISLDPREHVRLRPGVYAGDTSTPNQLLTEIFANALDEHNIGHGNEILVTIGKDGIVTVEDHGQGFPVNVTRPEDGKTILEAAFSVMNTSGKFLEDGVYEGTSLGLNGMGGKLSNFLSKWFDVRTCNNKGEVEHLKFQDGILQSRKIEKGKNHGTVISYKPDIQFFDTDKTDIKFFEGFFNDICCLCPKLKVVLNGKEIYHPNGIREILPFKIGKNIEIIDNQLVIMKEDRKNKLDLVLSFTSSNFSTIIPYVNYGYTDKGPHITAIKSTLTRIVNNWAKEKGYLKKGDKNLEGNLIQEGMVLVCNIKSTNVAYNAQVKSTITKMDTLFLTSTFGEELEVWLDNNPDVGKIIIEKALLARKAAEAAKKAKAAVKNKQKAVNNKAKILHPDKLKDAEFLGEDSTLLIVEGK